MNVFSTKVHGFLDYLMGLILLVAPSLLSLDRHTTEAMVFYTLGVVLLVYSILTNYELGMLRVLPMKLHLTLDVLSGIFLAASPWIFGFQNQLFIPYVALGFAEVIAGLTTTSRVGVPEVQEIIPTEIIQPHATKTSPSRHRAKPSVSHSITETKKAATSKKQEPATENKKQKATTETAAKNTKASNTKASKPEQKNNATAKKTTTAPKKSAQKPESKKK